LLVFRLMGRRSLPLFLFRLLCHLGALPLLLGLLRHLGSSGLFLDWLCRRFRLLNPRSQDRLHAADQSLNVLVEIAPGIDLHAELLEAVGTLGIAPPSTRTGTTGIPLRSAVSTSTRTGFAGSSMRRRRLGRGPNQRLPTTTRVISV
jgi:hypothetical protein